MSGDGQSHTGFYNIDTNGPFKSIEDDCDYVFVLSAPPRPPRKPQKPKFGLKLPEFKSVTKALQFKSVTKAPKFKIKVVKKPRRPKSTTPPYTTARPATESPNIPFIALVENESFRQVRGVDTFKPSLRDNLYLDNLLGKWIPGGIPNDYKWHGM